jgi:hypothetical protein
MVLRWRLGLHRYAYEGSETQAANWAFSIISIILCIGCCACAATTTGALRRQARSCRLINTRGHDGVVPRLGLPVVVRSVAQLSGGRPS